MGVQFKLLIFILSFLAAVSGCSSGDGKKDVAVQKKAEAYPATAEKVVRAFIAEIKKGNFKEAGKYTYKPDLNGASYEIIRKETRAFDSEYEYDTRNNSKMIGLRTSSMMVRQFSLNKAENKWKITETYVDNDDYFKDLATFVWHLQAQNRDLLYANYGNNKKFSNNEIDNLLKLFKDKDPVFTYPKLQSIYQQTIDHKIYKKGTSEGIMFHFTKLPGSDYSWNWKLGNEFHD